MTAPISPYLLDEPPTSTGRALLSRAFTHWCALNYGHTAEEIASAFERPVGADTSLRREVGIAARLLGELIAAGKMRTYARPFGGGRPTPIPESDWELDDFRPRMARSAIDPSQPFNPNAEPTHWVFVDVAEFNDIVEESCSDLLLPIRAAARAANQPSTASDAANALDEPDGTTGTHRDANDRHVRLPELVRRTGMSRSTIYRRIEAGRFPQQIPLDGNIAAWRERDVATWLADPR